MSSEIQKMSSLDVMWQWDCHQQRKFQALYGSSALCVIGADWDSATRKGLLWGDSHAEHFAPILDRVAKEQGVSLVLWRACPAYTDNKTAIFFRPDYPGYSERCQSSQEAALAWLKENRDIDLLVLAGAWEGQPPFLYDTDPNKRSEASGLTLMRLGFEKLFKAIPPTVSRIVLLGDVPRFASDPLPCAIRSLSNNPCNPPIDRLASSEALKRHAPTDRVLADVARQNKDRTIFVPSAGLMCLEEYCQTYVNSEFIYRDVHHLRRNLSVETFDKLIDLLHLKDVLVGNPKEREFCPANAPNQCDALKMTQIRKNHRL